MNKVSMYVSSQSDIMGYIILGVSIIALCYSIWVVTNGFKKL